MGTFSIRASSSRDPNPGKTKGCRFHPRIFVLPRFSDHSSRLPLQAHICGRCCASWFHQSRSDNTRRHNCQACNHEGTTDYVCLRTPSRLCGLHACRHICTLMYIDRVSVRGKLPLLLLLLLRQRLSPLGSSGLYSETRSTESKKLRVSANLAGSVPPFAGTAGNTASLRNSWRSP